MAGGAKPRRSTTIREWHMADFDKDDLDRRNKALDAALAARRPAANERRRKARPARSRA